MKLNFKKHVLSAATILAVAIVMPAQATYICTGNTGPADPSTPYFNGELTDVRCNIGEVIAGLGYNIDETRIIGSKTNAIGDPIGSWSQDQFDMGTLTVVDWTETSGTWALVGNTEPLFFVVRYGNGYDIFLYSGGGIPPFSDSWDDYYRGTIGASCKKPGDGTINCKAATGHISVYGEYQDPM